MKVIRGGNKTPSRTMAAIYAMRRDALKLIKR